ncbi:hypothetical protein AXF42_Ash018260 [Apostasia shenzhenica]|uniref:Secreted protein n=1 Tax=Apostasia shenzhenica TaxID=1088818 RepID=A0A2I0B2L8_9ASPA|nr:hypothetical protein AXF42_Ash018260 [Apostasia shenzhenica]
MSRVFVLCCFLCCVQRLLLSREWLTIGVTGKMCLGDWSIASVCLQVNGGAPHAYFLVLAESSRNDNANREIKIGTVNNSSGGQNHFASQHSSPMVEEMEARIINRS